MALHPITSFCNQKCIFCSAYQRDDDLFDIKDFTKEILSDRDPLFVISGGEPLSVGIDNLIYILNILNKQSKTTEIQTNALLIENIPYEKLHLLISLLNRNKGYFNINLSAHNKTTDYKLTGVKNGFEKRLSAIKTLSKNGATIRLTYVINSINYKHISDFSKLVVNKLPFINWVQFSFVKGIGKAKDNRNVIPKYTDVSPYLIKAISILDRHHIKFNTDHIPLCFLGKYWESNVDVNKMRNGIKGDYLLEKEKIKDCDGCKFYSICSGPRKDYIKVYKKGALKKSNER
jgi:MoaA/NifB/PqqE/SkfB family radical SAM enzyme